MKKYLLKSKKAIVFVFTILLIFYNSSAQNPAKAAEYLNLIGTENSNIQKELWDYISATAHSRSARKLDNKRLDLINAITEARSRVKKMHSYEGDYSLRDSIVSFLTLYRNVVNQDYAKIMDMEEVAEQSYDLMEVYLTANGIANNKLEVASEKIEIQFLEFAKMNEVKVVDNKDPLSKKLKSSSEALNYYNQVYLIFFKAYKQEVYLFDAISKKDINAIEQNRNALSSISEEGLSKLIDVKHFKGDNSLPSMCKRMLDFYKEEAEKQIPVIADFIVINEEYNKKVAMFESKDRMLLTNEEVDSYNKALEDYKKGYNKYISVNNALNSKSKSLYESWNNTVNSFMTRNVPKK